LSPEECQEYINREKLFLFDLYRIPFNGGKGGKPEPIPGASNNGMSNYFAKYSPDGKWIAYLSDASGEYKLMLLDQRGEEEPVAHSLGDPTFYYLLGWSPDSEKILYSDRPLNLFYFDLEEKQSKLMDTDRRYPIYDGVWSPDSKWITYTKSMDNELSAVFCYSIESGETHQITDGRSHAISPCFSLDGKYLYFAASTNAGWTVGGLDMSTFDRSSTYSLYLVVLNKDEPSPFAPESDEEKVEEESKGKGKK
jgi:tricorn protease